MLHVTTASYQTAEISDTYHSARPGDGPLGIPAFKRKKNIGDAW